MKPHSITGRDMTPIVTPDLRERLRVYAHTAGEFLFGDAQRALNVELNVLTHLLDTAVEAGELVYTAGGRGRIGTYRQEGADLNPLQERPDLIPVLLAKLDVRQETAFALHVHLTQRHAQLHATPDQVRATCERLRVDGVLRQARVGALRIYHLNRQITTVAPRAHLSPPHDTGHGAARPDPAGRRRRVDHR